MCVHRRLLGSPVFPHRRSAMSVVPRANGGAASFPRRERFYMRRIEQEVNQIVLFIDPCVKGHSRVLRQSPSSSESRINQKLNSDWRLSSSVRTVGNGRRAVRRVQVDLGALWRVSSDLPVVHRAVHRLGRACDRGPSATTTGDALAVCALCGRPNAVAHERVDRSEWHPNRIAWAEIHALDGG